MEQQVELLHLTKPEEPYKPHHPQPQGETRYRGVRVIVRILLVAMLLAAGYALWHHGW